MADEEKTEQEGAPKLATDFLQELKSIVTPQTPAEDEGLQKVKVPEIPEPLIEDEPDEPEEPAAEAPKKQSFLSRLW